MVRVIIAFTCVSLLCPASIAQVRPSGTKAPPAQSGIRSQPGIRAQPVTRTQQSSAEPPASARVELVSPRLNQESKPLDPVLADLLQQWSTASEGIMRLEGEHTRLIYDREFEVEMQSKGKFFYEKSDKGRIEVEPVPITPQLKADRVKEVAEAKLEKRKSGVRVKKRKEGQLSDEPYDLRPDQQELWCCDGQRVYSLDLARSEALVAQLPADMQGKNIMDSPLPFLFGMPPAKARRRFEMSFSSPFDPESGLAYLKILPRLPQDAQSWSQANVILDLKQFLPVAVQLLDPAETKTTVYKFRDVKVNKSTWISALMLENPKTRFTPDLRKYTVNNIGAEAKPAVAKSADAKLARTAMVSPAIQSAPADSGAKALVNVIGDPHQQAVLQLERQGLKRTKETETNEIFLQAGTPAQRKEDIYTVKSQEPPPGTLLKPGMKVTLVIWDDPAAAKKP